MALYAISDFHLALSGDKPMGIFGENWVNHHEKIKNNWLKLIKKEDTVLVAGDISWSMHMEEGMKDLHWIHELPGTKIFIKGNHDYFWTSIKKLNSLYEDMKFIQNNYFSYKNYAICGTRGWITPEHENFKAHDEKVYKREVIRLRLSLEAAVKDGYTDIIVMLHFPPFMQKQCEYSTLMDIIEEFKVQKVIYGHLHGPSLQKVKDIVNVNGVDYIMTSCDFLDFTPIKVID